MSLKLKDIIGTQIRNYRIKKDWTIEHLAEIIDISPQFLGAVERGERYLSVENFVKVSKALQVSLDCLILENTFEENSNTAEVTYLLSDLDDKKVDFLIKTLKCIKTNLKAID